MRSRLCIASFGLISLLALLIVSTCGFRWGLEFAGGTEMRFRTDLALSRDWFGDEVEIQEVTSRDNHEYLLRSQDRLDALTTHPDIEILSSSFVGPAIGEGLVRNTQLAVLASLGLILLYVSARFRFRHAVVAMVALLHDALAVLAALSLAGIPLGIDAVAAVLTVLGYSVNDSIVILDRVRENASLDPRTPFRERVTRALHQCLNRTLCLSAATAMSLVAFLVIGPEDLRHFCFALLVGLVAGLLSTIGLVPALLVEWEERYPTGA